MEKYKAVSNNPNNLKSEKEQKQEATEKAVDVLGEAALDAYTGGTFSKAKNIASSIPVIGKGADKAWNKAVKKVAKPLSKTPIGDFAKKANDTGITDKARQAKNMMNAVNSNVNAQNSVNAQNQVQTKNNSSLFNKFGNSASKLKSSDLINKGDFLSMLPKPLKIKIIIGCSIAFFFMMMVFVVFAGDDIHNLELMNGGSASNVTNNQGRQCTSDEISDKLIYVGDSRIVGMKDTINDSSSKFISEVGVGYDWLKNTASSSIDNELKDNSNSIVILSLGVNDLQNIDDYISFYDELIKKYSSNKFYILSVNPVDESKTSSNGYSVTNKDIDNFNDKIKAKFVDNYIDTNNGISTFDTDDGVHYNSETYKKINDYVVNDLVNDSNITCGSSIVESGEYTAWTQGDPKWGLIPVGSGPGNLAQIGCAVTSIAIQIARSGVNTSLPNLNPGTVCQNLQFSGEAVIWTSVSNFTNEFAYYTRENVSGLSGVGIYNALKPYLNDKYYMIIEVNYGQHWVAIKTIDSNGTVHIQDPAEVLVDDDLSKVYQGYGDVIVYEKK